MTCGRTRAFPRFASTVQAGCFALCSLILLTASVLLPGCGASNGGTGAAGCLANTVVACVCVGGAAGTANCVSGQVQACICPDASDSAHAVDTPGDEGVASTDTANTADGGSYTACKSDKDCSGLGLVCDPLLLHCVTCLTDAECSESHHCVDRTCEVYTGCTNSLGCTGAVGPDGKDQPICDQKVGECSACLTAADCPVTNDCVGKRCVPYVTCQSSTTCGADEVCNKATNRCVQCLSNNDCKSDEACESGNCRAYVPCASDKSCTPLGLLCDTGKGKCAQCLQNGDCPGIYNCQKVGVAATGVCVLDLCAQGHGYCTGNSRVLCNVSGSGWTVQPPCSAGQACSAPGGIPTCK